MNAPKRMLNLIHKKWLFQRKTRSSSNCLTNVSLKEKHKFPINYIPCIYG